MNWTAAMDLYCERTDPSLWSEPLNALSNLAFLVSALVMWRRVRGQGLPLAVALCAVLAVIGLGSFLFHTLAVGWAATADVLPILVFIMLYLFAIWRDYAGLRPAWAAAGALAYLPFAALTVPLFHRYAPWLGSSADYGPVPVLLIAFTIGLWRRAPATARGIGIGTLMLLLSLTFRTLDLPLCGLWPHGTHFVWHGLNAVMLGWMIEVYRRHMLAGRRLHG
ncbi:MAG: ceramidase [Rhodobacteraceae bacterium]|nr:ceramidase [Paracoccaceae bacterium]